LLSIKNVKKRLQFAREHIQKGPNFWNMIVWRDECKFNVFGSDGKPYVRRSPNKQLDPKYTKKTVKHGGASIMVWGCFTASGVGPLGKIDGIMNGEIDRAVKKKITHQQCARLVDSMTKRCSALLKQKGHPTQY